MKPKTLNLNDAAVLSDNKLVKGIVVDTKKVSNYERRRKKTRSKKK